ncbi:MAG: ATP-grasp domain-containing protein, partial [Patescibacteria group bacterium]
DVQKAYRDLGIKDVVVKAQVLSGKRGKNNGVKFCSTTEAVAKAVSDMFAMNIRGQYVAAVLIEEKLDIVEEHYISITCDTNKKQPMLIYSKSGGMDIEDVTEAEIHKEYLDVREPALRPHPDPLLRGEGSIKNENLNNTILPPRRGDTEGGLNEGLQDITQSLWECFLTEDTRQVEINPLVKTTDGRFVAADAKVAIDDDAFFRHGSTSSPQASGLEVTDWTKFEPRTMLGRLPTERELAVKKIDEGEAYYRGTAGKYIELDGDIALILNGGGASIANMDALQNVGLKAANYTEYSGNPPREKVYQLAKIVLSKPGIRGLWMCGVVANFTNMKETFLGIIDALDEIKPQYPIVVRRDGPESAEAFELMRACGERNHLHMKLFNKDMSMSESAKVLAGMLAHRSS